MCMLAARAAGATTIVITDLAANRLEAGKRLGADVIFRVGLDGDGDLVEAIRSGAIPRPDVTIEASGAQTGIANAIQVSPRRAFTRARHEISFRCAERSSRRFDEL